MMRAQRFFRSDLERTADRKPVLDVSRKLGASLFVNQPLPKRLDAHEMVDGVDASAAALKEQRRFSLVLTRFG